LLMVFRSFVMFSISSHILGCFDVIQEEIMQISKAKYLKIDEDFEKTMNKDSRCHIRHYKGRNCFPKSQDILYESKHPKGWRNMRFQVGNWTDAPQVCCHTPQVFVMCPDHAFMLQSHEICTYVPRKAPKVCWDLAITFFFFLVLSGKSSVFKPNSRWKLSL